MTVTRAQHDAILQIAEYGERIECRDLNIRPQTMKALVKKGFVAIIGKHAQVNELAWTALED